MEFTSDQIMTLLKIIIILALVWALIKYSVKVALSIVAILLIFQVGFMLTGTELNERFKMDKYLNDGYGTAVEGFFNDFRARGNKIAIVDQYAVYDGMVDGLDKGTEFAINQLQEIDIELLAENLARTIYETGEEAINEEELTNVINKNLKNVKQEDIDNIVRLTIRSFNEYSNNN